MSDVYLNYIGGQWKQGSTGIWDENRNPANPSEILGRATRSSALDVGRAIDAAVAAQKDWARRPRPQRGAVIQKAAELLKSKAENFAKTLTREEGKNLSEARGEVAKSVNVLEFMASEARRPTGECLPSEVASTFVYTTRAPLGVVATITPWNFPVCIPAWKIAPALLEGNAVIFKPASATPATATLLARLFEEAGLPAGVLNLVYGGGSAIGNAILDDSRVRAVSFTGSNEVGKAVYERAAKRLAKVQLEMGGKNPLIVLADADLDLAVEAAAMGAFGSTGQRCTATSRAIVEASVYDLFREKFLARARQIKVGDGLADPSAMGPIVDEKQYRIVLEAIEAAKREGALCLLGGEPVTLGGGYFLAPTVFDRVAPSSRLWKEEVFGPVLALMPASSFDEAMELANGVEYGLSSSIYTSNLQRVMRYATDAECGVLHVNSPTVGGEAHAPFGGMKSTGIGGREMGRTGPEFFCDIKTVYVDYGTAVRAGNLY